MIDPEPTFDELQKVPLLHEHPELYQEIEELRHSASAGPVGGGSGSGSGGGFKPATRTIALQSGGEEADVMLGDGGNRANIQEILDQAGNLGGGTVYIKRGTYLIEGQLIIPDNVDVRGDGFATILKLPDQTDFDKLIRMEDVSYASIHDIMIDGNGINQTFSPPNDLIVIRNAQHCTVERVKIINAIDSAIVLDQATATYNRIAYNIIDTTFDIGIYVSVSNRNQIIGNRVLNTRSYGIRVVNSGAAYNMVANNYVHNPGQANALGSNLNADGILVVNGDSTVVTGNFVDGAGRYGISFASPYIVCTANSVINSDEHGIYYNKSLSSVDYGAERSVISGNTIHNSGRFLSATYSGIYLNDVKEGVISGNRCGDTGSGVRTKYGIEEAGTSDHNLIVANILTRNGLGGVSYVGYNTTVAHNLSFGV